MEEKQDWRKRYVEIYGYMMNERVCKFNFECGDGWNSIIALALHELANIRESQSEDEPPITVTCVKEKFGVLHIYLSGGNGKTAGEAMSVAQNALEESAKTCEICGTREKVGCTMTGWMTTCCERCWRENERLHDRAWKYEPHDDDTYAHVEIADLPPLKKAIEWLRKRFLA